MGADSCQDVTEVAKWVDLQGLARRREAELDRGGPPAALAPEEKSILAAEGERLHGPLARVVVDRQEAGLDESVQRPADRALRQHDSGVLLQPGAEPLQQRGGPVSPQCEASLFVQALARYLSMPVTSMA
jgi:hypothetical protein